MQRPVGVGPQRRRISRGLRRTRRTRPPQGRRLHIELFGAAVSRRLRELMRSRPTDPVSARYSTKTNETGLIADTDDDDVGTLAEGVRVRLVGEVGNDRPPGQSGVTLTRTETMVNGYVDDPALTAASFINAW